MNFIFDQFMFTTMIRCSSTQLPELHILCCEAYPIVFSEICDGLLVQGYSHLLAVLIGLIIDGQTTSGII